MPSNKPTATSTRPSKPPPRTPRRPAPSSSASRVSVEPHSATPEPGTARAAITRRYVLRPYVDGDAMGLTCDSTPSNARRTDGKPDLAWGGTHNTLHPEHDEVVALSIEDSELRGRVHRVIAVSIDAQGNPHIWTSVTGGAVAPPIVDPGTTGRTVQLELVVIAVAGPDASLTTPQVRTAKCPVKIVFGPRLGGD